MSHSSRGSGSIQRPAAIRVVLADDHDLVRSGIKALLRQMAGIDVVAEARNGQQLVAAVRAQLPDIAITDLSMPGTSGLEAIAQLAQTCPGTRLMVLSMHDTAAEVRQAVQKGACAYLMKNAPPLELEHAIRQVARMGCYFSSQVARLLLATEDASTGDELTSRQVEVLQGIASGRASKQIAFDLGLSAKTVEAHRARIMERLGVASIAALTLYAIRRGLVDP
jgi:DNA-binding NarL/FixJ family response regulator